MCVCVRTICLQSAMPSVKNMLIFYIIKIFSSLNWILMVSNRHMPFENGFLHLFSTKWAVSKAFWHMCLQMLVQITLLSEGMLTFWHCALERPFFSVGAQMIEEIMPFLENASALLSLLVVVLEFAENRSRPALFVQRQILNVLECPKFWHWCVPFIGGNIHIFPIFNSNFWGERKTQF